ncbi:hypothetical protein K3495_g15288, partial [Podosphaera aphanis]
MYAKSESLKFMRKAIQLIKSLDYRVKYIHLDGESSLQRSLDELAIDEGFIVERTAPRTPEQNGQSEVNGRWIILKARAFAIEANLPQDLWPQLVVTVGYIMNRTPSRRLGWKTPFECVYGYKPPLSHLDIIGSKVYVLNKNIPRLDKLLARAHVGYLIGWESTNIYKVWIPSIGKIINSRDVTIDSGNLYTPHDLDALATKQITEQELIQALEWPSLEEDICSQPLETELTNQMNVLIPTNQLLQDEKKNAISSNSGNKEKFNLPGIFPEETPSSSAHLKISKGYKYIDDLESRIPSRHAIDGDRELARAQGNRAINAALINPDIDPQNIISRRTRNSKNSAHFAQYCYSFSSAIMNTKNWTKIRREELPPAPKGWDQMLRHQFSVEFQKAAEKELQTLEEKETWTCTRKEEVPESCKIVPLIWIFTYKFDSSGYLIKFKARLCARGDLLGSEEDPYAATLASQTFRAMMAITAAHDLEIRQYDVVNAFVNAPIRGEVYCHAPKGYN